MEAKKLNRVLEDLRLHVFRFEDHYQTEVDEECGHIIIRPNSEYGLHMGNVQWIAEVATFHDESLSVWIVKNRIELIIG